MPDPVKDGEKTNFGVKMVLNGQEFEVSEDLKKLLDAQNASVSEQLQGLQGISAELTKTQDQLKLMQEAQDVAAVDDSSSMDLDPEVEFFANPTKAVQEIVDKAVKGVETKLTNSYNKQQGETEFWSGFYGSHKNLKGYDDIVKMVLNQNYDELKPKPVAEAQEALGKLVSKKILELSKFGRGNEEEESDRTIMEGGGLFDLGGSGVDASDVVDDKAPKSLGEAMRNRRAKRNGG